MKSLEANRRACSRAPPRLGGRRGVAEPVGLVARLDDAAVSRKPIEQRGCHFRVAEDGGLFAEGEVSGDHVTPLTSLVAGRPTRVIASRRLRSVVLRISKLASLKPTLASVRSWPQAEVQTGRSPALLRGRRASLLARRPSAGKLTFSDFGLDCEPVLAPAPACEKAQYHVPRAAPCCSADESGRGSASCRPCG